MGPTVWLRLSDDFKMFQSIKKIIPQPIFRRLQGPYHFLLAALAALFYGFPSRNLVVIGVTGTDGKSSVVSLLHEIFLESGCSVASLSSLRLKINEDEETNMLKMTMPGRFAVQSFLSRARKDGARFVVLEVTSEGIKQFRHKFIRFSGAVITNVTPEHIESHGGFGNYLEAKAKLFEALGQDGVAILNRDDPRWRFFASRTRAKINFYQKEFLEIDGVVYKVGGLHWQKDINFSLGDAAFRSPLFGAFNVSNILAAAATARSFGVSFWKTADALKGIHSIPGRLEVLQEKPFRVLVDYAHTPNALRNVYETLCNAILNSQSSAPKLICVLGAAGGGRDKWKRPELGKIAGEFCGEIILTNEDPYDEPPHEIIEEVATGVGRSVHKIFNRREAIREALRLAKPDDAVIITGKGAEQWIMGPKNTRVPWDDRRVVEQELEKIPPAPH